MAYPMYALSVAHANDFASPDDFVKVSSGLLLLYGIGTMIGPVLAAFAMQNCFRRRVCSPSPRSSMP